MFNKILLLLLLGGSLFAQNIYTLERSLEIALSESYDIKNAKYSLINSQKRLEALKLGLNSSVNMEFDLPNYYRQLSSQFNTTTGSEEFYQVGATRLEGRLFITQPIIYTNSTFSLVGSLFGRDQFSDVTGTSRDYFSNLSIRLNQPIFTFNSQMANLERAEINLAQTERNYSKAELDIIYKVTSAFYNLFQAKRNVEITREKVKQTEISFETASNKYKAGLIAEVEKLQLEVDLAVSKNQLLDAERSYEEQLRNFKLTIGLPMEEEVDIEANLDYSIVNIDEELAINSALENRSELLNAKEDIYLQELTIDETDSRSELKAELNANYGINKNDELFENIFGEFQDNRSVVLTVSVPILDWGKNAREVEAAKAEYNRTELNYNNRKESITIEVKSAIGRVKASLARVQVLSKSVEVAEKSYNISTQRFDAGKITSFDLTQVQLRLTDAKLNSLNAIVDYKIALADLERKTYLKFQ
ncbi:MAG: membrane protein [Melioribacteraceae bacterium]|nr:MAG: membrane protein [Melioribacteraceae bacterium]